MNSMSVELMIYFLPNKENSFKFTQKETNGTVLNFHCFHHTNAPKFIPQALHPLFGVSGSVLWIWFCLLVHFQHKFSELFHQFFLIFLYEVR